MTASTSSRASASSRSTEAWTAPYFRATSWACSSLRLTTEVTVTPSMAASAIRMCLVLFLAGRVGGPQHDVPDRGVGSRDVVEAVQLLDVAAQSAAHDQPHDQLDALGTRFAHVLDVWHAREAVRVLDEPVEERGVELLVDEARAGPLQLVAHAAGAPDRKSTRL